MSKSNTVNIRVADEQTSSNKELENTLDLQQVLSNGQAPKTNANVSPSHTKSRDGNNTEINFNFNRGGSSEMLSPTSMDN